MDIFSGEERSEIRRFFEGSGTPGMAGEENGSMTGSGFFQNFHHGAGDSVNFASVIFKKEHGLFQAVNVRILGQK